MDTVKTIFLWIGGAIIALLVGFFLLGFIVFLVLDIRASANSRYWIDTGGTTYYTNAYEEKDGCVFFHENTTDHDVKQCGFYSISDKGDKK
jgi:ABC-type antimicrobial peptide transport system permease subunit